MVAVSLKKFFFKQKTAYEMCGRDWSSDVCSSDLGILNIIKVFQEYLDYIQNPRSFTKVVRDNSELTINDKIVTLSTCLNSGDGRLLLQGVLIKDELTK